MKVRLDARAKVIRSGGYDLKFDGGVVLAYLFLALAICAEVIATMSLRASEGFSRHGFVVVLVIGYVTAFALLNASLMRGMPLGMAYGIWAAIGIGAVALLSIPFFGETFTPLQAGGLLLIILGVLALEMGAAHD